MPTKPVATFTFATDATFSSGPASGFATKIVPGSPTQGFIPGTGINAEWVNYLMNICGQWIDGWVLLGTSAADEDAHIVETNASGKAFLAQLSVAPTTAGSVAFSVVGTAGDLAASIQSSGAGNAVGATANGTGYAVDALANANHGVRGRSNDASFAGGFFDNLASGGDGVIGNSAGNGRGVYGLNNGTGSGVRGEGTGGTANGVVGTSDGSVAAVLGTNSDSGGTGVAGSIQAGATTSAEGVLGSGAGDGVGVRGVASDGNGVWAQSDTTSPQRAALHVEPQDADPVTQAEGDIWYESTSDQLRARIKSQSQGIHATPDGIAWGSSTGGTGTASNAGWVTVSSLTMLGGDRVGQVLLQGIMELGAAGGVAVTTMMIRIRDVTAGVDVFNRTIDHPNAATGPIHDRPWSVEAAYTLPAAGSRQFDLQIQSPVADQIQARDGSLSVRGTF